MDGYFDGEYKGYTVVFLICFLFISIEGCTYVVSDCFNSINNI